MDQNGRDPVSALDDEWPLHLTSRRTTDVLDKWISHEDIGQSAKATGVGSHWAYSEHIYDMPWGRESRGSKGGIGTRATTRPSEGPVQEAVGSTTGIKPSQSADDNGGTSRQGLLLRHWGVVIGPPREMQSGSDEGFPQEELHRGRLPPITISVRVGVIRTLH
ncbi:hypothetical protein LX36DRAFT_701292 [Colletotrichum falcatum]|nr:hypothetical protein LX36DRAFT_701292 [Colletotrichum falcatum]